MTAPSSPISLAIFSCLWAIAECVHRLGTPGWIQNPLAWLTLLAAGAVLLRPTSSKRLVLLAASGLIYIVAKYPMVPNHFILEALVNGCIIVSALYLWPQKGRTEAYLLEYFSAPARVMCILLYFFAVLHKLNYDFLNPEVSCGSFLLQGMAERLPFLPVDFSTRQFAIFGTLLMEAIIPLLIVFRSSRVVALMLAIPFHFLLIFYPNGMIMSFTALMYALFFLFFTDQFVYPNTQSLWAKRFIRIYHYLIQRKLILFSCIILILGYSVYNRMAGGSTQAPSRAYLNSLIFGGYTCILLMGYFVFRKDSVEQRPSLIPPIKRLWIGPVLMIFIGLSPYLDLQTETSFSMFSNLRTDAYRANHLFMPRLTNWTGNQDDLIEFIDSSHSDFKNKAHLGELMTFFEFRRKIHRMRGEFWIDYLHQGELKHIQVENGRSNVSKFAPPLRYWEKKLFRYRSLDKGPQPCRH